jgi:hypothetical protein
MLQVKIIKYLTIVFLLLIFNSCSLENKIELPSDFKEVPPIKLTLAQAFSVQKSLFVKANIEILDDIAAEDVVIGAIGLKEGLLKEEQYTPLSKVWNKKIITKGTSIVVPFEWPISNITEFQLKCSWGEEAKKVYVEGDLNPPEPKKAELTPSIITSEDGETIERGLAKKGIIIDSINVEEETEECNSPPCKKKVKIRAIVKNLRDTTLTHLSLAFGLFWTSEGKVPKLPKDYEARLPNEEELTFGELNLPSGGSIPFNVNIGRSVSEVKGGEFRPHIRILSFK